MTRSSDRARPVRPARRARRLRVLLRLSVAVCLAVPGAALVTPPAGALIGDCDGDGLHPPLDLTGDFLPDRVIGEPGRGADAGAVHIVSSPATGIVDLRLVQGAAVLPGGVAVPGTDEAGDRFGAATLIADFDGDSCDDLAIGAPGENDGRGAVTVLFGGRLGNAVNRVFTENAFAGGKALPGEGCGSVLAAADLDGDGRAELLIGAPGERVTASGRDQGGVAVVTGVQLFTNVATFPQPVVTASYPGVPGTAERGDRFGAAIATGDFDADKDVDLAVGVPGENGGRGAVVAFTNPGKGLTGTLSAKAFDQDSPGVPGTAEAGDRFGAALAGGDVGFPGAFMADLAVGAPGEDSSTGSVTFLPGSAAGLTGAGSTVFTRDAPGVAGVSRAGARFGAALDIDVLEEGFPNTVIVGVPGDAVSGHAGAGSVTFLASSASGPAADGGLLSGGLVSQDSGGVPGTAEAGDGFGSALKASGWDLFVGVPGEDLGGVTDAGAMNFFDGSAGLGPEAAGTILLEAGTPGITGARDAGGRFAASVDG